MKVIFLDFNGVLDTNEKMDEINSDNLKRLKHIVEETDAKIVISSSIKTSYFYTGKYGRLLLELIKRLTEEKMEVIGLTPNAKSREEELFWNEIMKEHAEFIRGLLDPSEKELILTANKFANNYEQLLNNYANNPVRLTEESLRETINLRNFKVTGEEGILNCKIKSIITPLLADHVVREANHFIRILRNENKLIG